MLKEKIKGLSQEQKNELIEALDIESIVEMKTSEIQRELQSYKERYNKEQETKKSWWSDLFSDDDDDDDNNDKEATKPKRRGRPKK